MVQLCDSYAPSLHNPSREEFWRVATWLSGIRRWVDFEIVADHRGLALVNAVDQQKMSNRSWWAMG